MMLTYSWGLIIMLGGSVLQREFYSVLMECWLRLIHVFYNFMMTHILIQRSDMKSPSCTFVVNVNQRKHSLLIIHYSLTNDTTTLDITACDECIKECHWWLLMWNVCLITKWNLRWQQEIMQRLGKINTWQHSGERSEEETHASSSQRPTCTACRIIKSIIKKCRLKIWLKLIQSSKDGVIQKVFR